MRLSTDRILTTHTGSLPRPAALVELLRKGDVGEPVDERAFQAAVSAAVGEGGAEAGRRRPRRRQRRRAGQTRLRHLHQVSRHRVRRAEPGHDRHGPRARVSRNTVARHTGNTKSSFLRPVCNGPIEWRDFAAVRREIDTPQGGHRRGRAQEVFMSAASPGGRLDLHGERVLREQ